MKIALVVGHTNGADKGAFSPYLKQSEQPYNHALAQALKSCAPSQYDVYTHNLQNYYDRQKFMAGLLNKQKYDLVLELHFNAASPAANGTECLYYFASAKGKLVAQKLAQGISYAFDTTLRGDAGARALTNKNDRGYWAVYLPKAVAVIYEPFFGSNVEALKFKDVALHASEMHSIIQNLKI